MKLYDLHQFEQFRNNRYVKVLRHKDSRRDLWDLRKKGRFGHYQIRQSWDVFGSAHYIIQLSSVSGVYVLLYRHTGKQYVGSAYGSGGIWARWRSYAKSPSGGNILLKQILEKSPSRYNQFQFSVLRVLEPSATKDEVMDQEALTKKKLGSRAFGLNSN